MLCALKELQPEYVEGFYWEDRQLYDYLIVGAGLYGAVFAQQLSQSGRSVLVVDRRHHLGGNIFTEELKGIQVHRYGAHIFHTNDNKVWEYVNRFAFFNRFTNSPVANYQGEIYFLPFNMYTFHQLWGVVRPEEARRRIEEQRLASGIQEPRNLEEQAISQVGQELYEKLVKGYTEKQWGRSCRELPASIFKRLPVRFTYDNNYFNAMYQGIPVGGYTGMVEKMLDGIDFRLETDYLKQKNELDALAEKVVYTGPIDAYYGYCYGELEYRSLRFETGILDCPNYQGNAVMNYTDSETPFTRVIEHKWFEFGRDASGKELPWTVITREYPLRWERGVEPYYPVNDDRNQELYGKYRALADKEKKVIFGGRLGEYRYYDMDTVVGAALRRVEMELKGIHWS